MRVQSNPNDIGVCGCGRSPTGKCNGWHGLSEEAYAMELELWHSDEANAPSMSEQTPRQAQ